uniref:Uncharacterized protein n=1 Tax=Timema cristinae TaxID=61476 RepID=A0A7R9CX95_TIMCR|nr:unnamed protein product [Timema cristinae]
MMERPRDEPAPRRARSPTPTPRHRRRVWEQPGWCKLTGKATKVLPSPVPPSQAGPPTPVGTREETQQHGESATTPSRKGTSSPAMSPAKTVQFQRAYLDNTTMAIHDNREILDMLHEITQSMASNEERITKLSKHIECDASLC